MKPLRLIPVLILAAFIASLWSVNAVQAQEEAKEKAKEMAGDTAKALPKEKAKEVTKEVAKEKVKGVTKEKSGNPVVLFKTTMGSFKVELFEKEAPITVKNFLNYVDKKFYDGTAFHRVAPGFVIQGGGFDKNKARKNTDPPIQNEAANGLKNLKGTLSMARTSDVNSATSQFFVNLKDNAVLDHVDNSPERFGYAVFGKVIQGWNVIEKIAAAEFTPNPSRPNEGEPKKPIVVQSAMRIHPGQQTPAQPATPPKKTK